MTTMAELNSLAKEYGFSTTVSSLTKLMEMGRADHSEEPKDRESIKALAGAGYAGGVMDLLKVDEGGVDPDSLEVRRHIFGENKIEHAPPKSYLELCWIAAQDSTLVLLEIAATVSLVLETSTADEDHIDTAWIEGTAIFVTIFVVINVTAFNDYKKEQQFRALKAKSEEGTKVPVFRKGNLASIPVNPDELVVGDIVDVKHGQVVQADGILLKADTPIAVDEAALTGESDVQIKDPQTGPFMLAGTSVRTGQGRMVVVAVGLNHTDGALTASITGAGASEAERQGEVERALDVNDGLSPHLMSDDENEGLVRSARRDAAKLEAKVNELAQAIERKRAVQQVAVTKRNNKKVAKMDAQIAELQAESEAKQNTANELRDAATALERAAGNDGNIVKLKEVIKKAHREVEGESNKAPEDDKDTVLTRKLEKLAWSIGGVASIMAVLCLVGLIIRLLITSYSDCDGCDNDGWGTDKWGEVVSFFIISVTVLVVAIPEGLPLAVTISLAYSVRKMQKDMCLVRVLASCETMGNAQHVCSDKTGTLTQNKMSVRAIFIGGEVYSTEDGTFEASRKLPEEILMGIAEQGSLNSSRNAGYIPKPKAATGKKDDPKKIPLEERVEEADKNNYRSEDSNEVEQVGSKTDCAILLLVDYYEPVTKSTYRDCRNRYGVAVKQFDFDHKKKRMSTVVERPNGVCFPQGTQRLYVKGAPSYLIDLCTKMSTAEGSVELTQERKDLIMNVISGFEDNAFRVLLLAYKDVDAQTDLDDEDNLVAGLTLQAITGIIDPARPEVIGALESCKKAGVTVRMVTGDSPKTATAIALNIGLLTKDEAANAEEGGYVMLGKDFENRVTTDPATGEVDWKEVSKIWPNLRVMGRCEPKHKEILVRGLKKDGEIVAVTGDGTNDAPALAKADVGFAMGLTGTPAAREASDIVLLDDNFASIVKAIKWGRNVYDSISKFLVFQLTVNVVAVIVAFIGSIAIGTTPLRATQMLWVNLIMDTFASLALATERPVEALLQRSPYPRDAPLLTKHMAKQILGHSVYQLIVLFTLLFEGYKWFDLDDGTKEDYDGPPTEHLTLVFNTFVWMTLFNQLNARRIDGNLNVFSGLDTNPMYLMIMVSASRHALLPEARRYCVDFQVFIGTRLTA